MSILRILRFFVGCTRFWQNPSLLENDAPPPNQSDNQQVSHITTKRKSRRLFFALKLWNWPFNYFVTYNAKLAKNAFFFLETLWFLTKMVNFDFLKKNKKIFFVVYNSQNVKALWLKWAMPHVFLVTINAHTSHL